jgi:hypothetical protein
MNRWVDERRILTLQEIASHLGSTIQQIFFSLNHTTISAGIVTQKSTVPRFIEIYPYTGTATLVPVSGLGSSKALEITLQLGTVGTTVKASAILGSNVLWQESVFVSNSTNACIVGEKFTNGTICLFFGG